MSKIDPERIENQIGAGLLGTTLPYRNLRTTCTSHAFVEKCLAARQYITSFWLTARSRIPVSCGMTWELERGTDELRKDITPRPNDTHWTDYVMFATTECFDIFPAGVPTHEQSLDSEICRLVEGIKSRRSVEHCWRDFKELMELRQQIDGQVKNSSGKG